MREANVHKHSLFVNIVPKYTEVIVELVNGVGSVVIPEFYQSAEITFGSTTEPITISDKSFIISDTGYSGNATVMYYAKDICRKFLFSLFVSGVSQVQTFLAKFYIKISGSATGSFLKNMLSTIYFKEKSTSWLIHNLKGTIAAIGLDLKLLGHIGSLKKTASTIEINLDLTRMIDITRVVSAYFTVNVDTSADITVARYIPISFFAANTLDDLLTKTLEEMIFTVD